MPVNPTLPTPGGDDGTWGDELNAALGVIVAGVNAEETARAAADTALGARVDVVEATLPTLATTASVTALDGRVDVLEAAPSGTSVSPSTPLEDFPAGLARDTEVAAEVTALRALTVGVVYHGATAGTARPTGFGAVQWVGTVEPANAVDGDTWVSTA